MAVTDYAVPASALHAAVKSCGVNAVTTVPDLVQFAFHDRLKRDSDIRYIECAAENQAVTVAFGMYVGGLVPLVLMQNQGLFNCINTVRSVGIDGRMPLVLSVGQFGREMANLGKPTTQSSRVCVNRVEPVLDALQLPYFNIETPADIGKVKTAFETARAKETACVLVIGHYPGLGLSHKENQLVTLTTNEACAIIAKHRGDALVVSTMSAMFAISALSPSPLNLSSVPLMGGACGIGLGLAVARPNRAVLVLDGDASLLMELGSLAIIGGERPANLVHFVFNNNVQFGGFANLQRPGGKYLDFSGMAASAGYASTFKIASAAVLAERMPEFISGTGPVFVELMIEPPQKFGQETPQVELPDMQFLRMSAEAKAMKQALTQTAVAQ